MNLDGALLRLQALGNPAAKFDARQFNWFLPLVPIFRFVGWVKPALGQHYRRIGFFEGAKTWWSGARDVSFRQCAGDSSCNGINLRLVDGFKGVTEIRLATRAAKSTAPAHPYEGVQRSFPRGAKKRRYKVIAQSGRNRGPDLKTSQCST